MARTVAFGWWALGSTGITDASGNAQPGHPADPQLRIRDRVRARSHPAGARRVGTPNRATRLERAHPVKSRAWVETLRRWLYHGQT